MDRGVSMNNFEIGKEIDVSDMPEIIGKALHGVIQSSSSESIVLEVARVDMANKSITLTDPTRMATTKEKMDLALAHCTRVYGTCTDGSFESCLISLNYYKMLRALKELSAKDVSIGQEIKPTFSQSL